MKAVLHSFIKLIQLLNRNFLNKTPKMMDFTVFQTIIRCACWIFLNGSGVVMVNLKGKRCSLAWFGSRRAGICKKFIAIFLRYSDTSSPSGSNGQIQKLPEYQKKIKNMI